MSDFCTEEDTTFNKDFSVGIMEPTLENEEPVYLISFGYSVTSTSVTRDLRDSIDEGEVQFYSALS